MIRKTLAVAALLMLAGAAQADDKSKSSNDLVCTYSQDTGSHIKHRTCETRASADERREKDKNSLNRAANMQNTQDAMSRMAKNPG